MADSGAGNKPGFLNIQENNVGAIWKLWKEELEFYMLALGVKQDEDERRIAMLLSLAGPDSRQVFTQFEFDEAAHKVIYKKVVEKFEQYCAPRVNLIYEIQMFITRKQQEGERFDSFVMAVKTLASTCELGALKDTMIASVIIAGVRDRSLKEKMIREVGVNLKKVIQMGRLRETTSFQMKIMHPEDGVVIAKVDINSGNGGYYAPRNVNVNRRGGFQPNKGAGRGNASEFQCRRCDTRHRPRACPAFRFQCGKCNKFGHYTKVCVAKINIIESHEQSIHDGYQEEPQRNNSDFFIGVIKVVDTQDLPRDVNDKDLPIAGRNVEKNNMAGASRTFKSKARRG